MIAGARRRHPFSAFAPALGFLTVVVAYGTVGYIVIERFPPLDALYQTVITVTTVGFEELHPIGAGGQVFTITLIVSGVLGFFYTFGVIAEQVSTGRWSAHRRYVRMEAKLRSLHDHVIVCGYGRTGKQVVRELQASRSGYVVVEMNPTPLVDVHHDAVLCVEGDATNDEVLHHAGIERARALVSAVDSDERNVYIVLTARSLNPRLYIVARSSYPDSQPKLRRAGADRVVSPYTLSGRRMAALALQPAVVDVLDMVLTEGAGMAVEELVVPPGAGPMTVGSLRRHGAFLLALRGGEGSLAVAPDDAQALAADDLLVAMGTPDQLAALASALRPPRLDG